MDYMEWVLFGVWDEGKTRRRFFLSKKFASSSQVQLWLKRYRGELLAKQIRGRGYLRQHTIVSFYGFKHRF